MKRIGLIILVICLAFIAKAQIQKDPAHWAYGLKKLSGNTYEVHIQATIDNGWHIYAQEQTKDFIGTATKINFNKVPGLTLINKPIGIGKKEIYHNQEVGITNYEYAGKVDFVQKVRIKPGLKEIKGTVNYQTCTDQKCLDEQTLTFTIPIK